MLHLIQTIAGIIVIGAGIIGIYRLLAFTIDDGRNRGNSWDGYYTSHFKRK